MGSIVTHVDAGGLEVKDHDGQATRYEAGNVLWTAGVEAPPLATAVATATGAEQDRACRWVRPGPVPARLIPTSGGRGHDEPGEAARGRGGRHADRAVHGPPDQPRSPGTDDDKPFRYHDLGSAAYIPAAARWSRRSTRNFVASWAGGCCSSTSASSPASATASGALFSWWFAFTRDLRRERTFTIDEPPHKLPYRAGGLRSTVRYRNAHVTLGLRLPPCDDQQARRRTCVRLPLAEPERPGRDVRVVLAEFIQAADDRWVSRDLAHSGVGCGQGDAVVVTAQQQVRFPWPGLGRRARRRARPAWPGSSRSGRPGQSASQARSRRMRAEPPRHLGGPTVPESRVYILSIPAWDRVGRGLEIIVPDAERPGPSGPQRGDRPGWLAFWLDRDQARGAVKRNAARSADQAAGLIPGDSAIDGRPARPLHLANRKAPTK